MAKASKSKSQESRAIRGVLRPWMGHLAGIVVLMGVIATAVWAARKHVDRDITFPRQPPQVVIKDRPVWMSDVLAEQIVRLAKPAGARSVYDHQLLREVSLALESNPWVKQVNAVRRLYAERPGDTIEIDAEFRAPLAMVKWGDYYWLIDGDAYKLPEQFRQEQVLKIVRGTDGRTNIRVIEGVLRPPPQVAEKWLGADLAAGLEMVKLLYGKRYADEIISVDVSNFDGRRDAREAHIVLGTHRGTQIRWGRVPSAKDAFVEVPAAKKLEYLQQVWEQYQRVDAAQPWIDIRFDRITYPAAQSMEHADTR
jgi:hypothetical protein